ncbi:ThiF family adenylyltransferase [Corynebacterium falsenii]|uniref:ThiF family adenylyltransferase n=1 Tax=Corynebacterium falsenii TaxID=108486 RepID=UPI00234D73C9|nr:ThiF family adenylyltransferase [Corynebacterium falsenii]MDC7103142.1 ThiF family adenylyltransferase [Corynebacterium falsenii]
MGKNNNDNSAASPDAQWIARYRRQLTLEGFGMAAQRRLSRSHAVVIGAGGLGAPALLYLAAAGVGHITVIDDDTVELSNLHRQIIHTESAIGESKVNSAAEQMRQRNSHITITAVHARITDATAADLIATADIVLDGTDNFPARYATSAACSRARVPHIWGSILGFDAQLSVFWQGHGPVYTDVFPEAPPAGAVPSCAEAGVLGPLVGVVGTAMALEAVKILGGVGEPLVGVIAYLSGMSGRWEYIELATPEGSVPVSTNEEVQVGEALVASNEEDELLIDVREQGEYDAFHIPGARLVPLSGLRREVPEELVEELRSEQQRGRDVVVYCAAGVRSREAIEILAEAGVEGLRNMDGGINAWLDGEQQR